MRKMAAALAFFTALAGGSALAQDKPVNLKISLWVPAAHPLVPASKVWADSIEKASGGTIKATIFPSEQLGKAVDHYDMARDGIADVTYVNPGYQPGRFPIVSLGQVPFIFADGHKGTQAFDAWYRKYAAAEMKDTKYCFGFIHDPGGFHSRTKKVVVPDDIKGMKIRPAQSTIGQMVTMLGGTNVQASAPESRDAIERGAFVGPIERKFEIVAPTRNEVDVKTNVIASLSQNDMYGQNHVVFISAGSKAGLKPGNRLFAMRTGDGWIDSLPSKNAATRIAHESNAPAEVERVKGPSNDSLPPETMAEIRVISVKENTSLCIVTDARRELSPGDAIVARKGY